MLPRELPVLPRLHDRSRGEPGRERVRRRRRRARRARRGRVRRVQRAPTRRVRPRERSFLRERFRRRRRGVAALVRRLFRFQHQRRGVRSRDRGRRDVAIAAAGCRRGGDAVPSVAERRGRGEPARGAARRASASGARRSERLPDRRSEPGWVAVEARRRREQRSDQRDLSGRDGDFTRDAAAAAATAAPPARVAAEGAVDVAAAGTVAAERPARARARARGDALSVAHVQRAVPRGAKRRARSAP
mmetsp:Transcript_6106/g.22362  ORF Transcript_6106/g.22362 Transcript_6106/m.22362 type:complete len:246 (+) Transcript_6106:413-1150(+)